MIQYQDFDDLKNHIDISAPRFFLFKEKQWGEKIWAFVAYIPDTLAVSERMTYGSSLQHLKVELGDMFTADKRISEAKDLTWNVFKGFESQSEKPWSNRELAIIELDKGEQMAREESSKRPQLASGYHSVSYPLTEDAKQAVTKLKSGEINWIQLSIDESKESITSVATKQVSISSMGSHVDNSVPQFYLISFEGSTVLVYCCPENSPLKSRMIYSTCKAALADSLKGFGVTLVKKYDIRSPDELNEADLKQRIREKSSTMFKPSDVVRTGGTVSSSNSYSSTGGRVFDKNQFDSSKPVFQRGGYNKPHSETTSTSKVKTVTNVAPLAKVMGLGSGGPPKKGIVIPPKGAY